jgi:hypothetical protein
MFGFPPILDGNAGIKFTKDADSGFPKPGIREIFYSIKDGNWTDRTVWETASGRVGLLPTANDDVYVRHTISGSGGGGNAFANTLYITPTGALTVVSYTFNLNNIISNGIINVNTNVIFNLLDATKSYIDKTKQVEANIYYAGQINQPIIDANYRILGVFGRGEKYLTCDLTVTSYSSQNAGVNCWLNLKNFNFTCNGLFSTVNSGAVYCEGNQYLLFKGLTSFNQGFYCLTAPTIEFQNGIGSLGYNGNILNWTTPYGTGQIAASYLGTGLVKFTTNSQSIAGGGGTTPILDNTITIDDGITLTNTISSTSLTINGSINGVGATSRLVNAGTLNFGTATAATTAMTTGIWDFTTNANTIGYTGNYSATIPSYFTNFHSLAISGTGTKTLSANTVLNGNLSLGTATGILELSTFNFTVNGTSSVSNSSSLATTVALTKSGSGNVLFVGLLNIGGSGKAFLDFSIGNPNVECRGGILTSFTTSDTNNGGGLYGYLNTGTNTWTFANNQTITSNFGYTRFNCPIIIGSGVTLSIAQNNNGGVNLLNTINGTSGTSRLLMLTNGFLIFGTSTAASTPITTGTWDFTTNANTVWFRGDYSATMPSVYTTFHNLTISGTGTKTLGVNTTLNGNLSVNAGTLQLSTFNLNVSGTTTIFGAGGSLIKSGSGNVLFNGLLTIGASSNVLNFSVGNPTVELRGGIYFDPFSTTFSTGTGQWTFSTASQTIFLNNYTATFDCPILINGAIDLTINGNQIFARDLILTNTLNGNNANSKLINRFRINISTTTAFTGFMSVGILDITTFTNTIIYSFNGNATIPYTTFSGLIIRGTGTKTLSNNTTLSAALAIDGSGTLELSTFNLSVTGTTTIGDGNAVGNLSKNSIGDILFGNRLTMSRGSINFSGNPNVELRNGTDLGPFITSFNSGTGTWTFTTQSQQFGFNNQDITFNCGILISGAITVTFTQLAVAGGKTVILNGLLNGNNAASTFRMGATTLKLLSYNNAVQPMATGVLDTSTNLNTFIYGAGNQDVKGGVTPQQYRNLRFSGSGTTKTLQGNINVQNTYTVDAGVTVNLNGFTKTP